MTVVELITFKAEPEVIFYKYTDMVQFVVFGCYP